MEIINIFTVSRNSFFLKSLLHYNNIFLRTSIQLASLSLRLHAVSRPRRESSLIEWGEEKRGERKCCCREENIRWGKKGVGCYDVRGCGRSGWGEGWVNSICERENKRVGEGM